MQDVVEPIAASDIYNCSVSPERNTGIQTNEWDAAAIPTIAQSKIIEDPLSEISKEVGGERRKPRHEPEWHWQ